MGLQLAVSCDGKQMLVMVQLAVSVLPSSKVKYIQLRGIVLVFFQSHFVKPVNQKRVFYTTLRVVSKIIFVFYFFIIIIHPGYPPPHPW